MNKEFQTVIVGSGFAGIGAAIYLLKKGHKDFVILERHEMLGGTWYINSYPGAQVDVDSYLYCFEDYPYDWSRRFATRDEILAYTYYLIEQNNLYEKSICNCNVTHTKYDSNVSKWTVSSNQGEYKCKDLILACGHLSNPYIPKIEGLQSFEGPVVHSAKWNKGVEYVNKKVAVIGTGASGIQIVPAIADSVLSLEVFQRTPHYITHRGDKLFSDTQRKILRMPFAAKIYRKWLYWTHEYRAVAFAYFPFILKVIGGAKAKKYQKTIKDKALRKKITPDFPIGCKRVLLSDDFYAAFEKTNVHLHTQFHRVVRNGIELSDGTIVEVDLIVLATGFEAFRNPDVVFTFQIIGREDMSLADFWRTNGIKSYLTSTNPYFPNLYLVGGPNSATGHTSAIYMIESSLRYIVDAIDYRIQNNINTIEVRKEVWDQYNHKLSQIMKKSVWNQGCNSWYQSETGENPSIYPGFTFIFKKDCKFKPTEHNIQ